MKNIKISIVIPVYNIEEYIGECIDSVLAQSYHNWECILVDDESTDRSSEICKKYETYDSRIRVIRINNGGPSTARNTGLLESQGDYVFFLDGDDKITHYAMEHFVEIVKDNKDCDFILGHMAFFYDNNIPIPQDGVVKKEWVDGFSGKEAFVNIYAHTGKIVMGIRGLYKRKFIMENNLLLIWNCRYSEDQEWIPRLFEKGNKISSNENPDYLYRVGRPGSLMNSLNLEKMESTLKVYDKWYEDIMHHDDVFYNCLYKILIDRYWSLYFNYTPMVPKENMKEFCDMMERRRLFAKKTPKVKKDYRHWIIKNLPSSYIIKLTQFWVSIH